ncbi:hypothetical protein [Pseudomonas phage GP100]|nr:hypothetical protein [Pseudomonas phage GP100]
MTFTVVRSPAKVCWWVLCNGVLVMTRDTKREAVMASQELTRAYT